MGASDAASTRYCRADHGGAVAQRGRMGRAESRGRQAGHQWLGNARIGRDAVPVVGGFACSFTLVGRAGAFDASRAARSSRTRALRFAFCFTFLGRAGPGSVDRRRTHVGLARAFSAARNFDVGTGPGLGCAGRACAVVGRTRLGCGVAGDPVSSVVESAARARLGRTGRVLAAGSRRTGRAFRRRLGRTVSGRRTAANR